MTLRQEYPRPHFVRKNWQPLNGVWGFDFDEEDQGLSHEYYLPDHKFSRTIVVPFSPQSVAGSINDENLHAVMWYQKKFLLA
ncbi:MAG: glycoside hydrolase family 2, partial [Bacilli bacterium]